MKDKNEVRKRITITIQAKGGIGKSTEIMARTSWLDKRQFIWTGYDLDGQHEVLFQLYPESVVRIPISGNLTDVDSIGRMFREILKAQQQLTVVDVRAHLDNEFRLCLQHVDLERLYREQGTRLTVILYAMEDLDVLANIAETLDLLHGKVDFVICINEAHSKHIRSFTGSRLEQQFTEAGAEQLRIPYLSADVRRELSRLEIVHKRRIPIIHALADESLGLDLISRAMLETWLREMFRQYDRIGSHLLPSSMKTEAPQDVPRRNGRSRGEGTNFDS